MSKEYEEEIKRLKAENSKLREELLSAEYSIFVLYDIAKDVYYTAKTFSDVATERQENETKSNE